MAEVEIDEPAMYKIGAACLPHASTDIIDALTLHNTIGRVWPVHMDALVGATKDSLRNIVWSRDTWAK